MKEIEEEHIGVVHVAGPRPTTVCSEPLAFVSMRALGQLIADKSGEYMMTVPRDLPGRDQMPLYTWPNTAPVELADIVRDILLSANAEEELPKITDPETIIISATRLEGLLADRLYAFFCAQPPAPPHQMEADHG